MLHAAARVGVTASTWALDHYGPPATTTALQTIQILTSTATPPSGSNQCTNGSFYVYSYNSGASTMLYPCVNGTWVQTAATGGVGATGATGAAGAPGAAATVAVGTVTTLAAGSSATVTNSGSSSAATLNFALPRGATGATAPQGPSGGATGATGPAGPPVNFRGAWSSGTTYAIGDAVSDGGSSYIGLTASNVAHNPTTDTTDWAVLAQAGATGPAGQVSTATLVNSLNDSLGAGRNLCNPAMIVGGTVGNTGNGAGTSLTFGTPATSAGGYVAMQCDVLGATQIVTNVDIYNHGGYGYQLLDANGLQTAFISTGTDIVKGTPVTIPAGTGYIVFFTYNAGTTYGYTSASQLGAVAGATLPSTMPAWGFASSSVAAVAATNSTAITALQSVATPFTHQNICWFGDSISSDRLLDGSTTNFISRPLPKGVATILGSPINDAYYSTASGRPMHEIFIDFQNSEGVPTGSGAAALATFLSPCSTAVVFLGTNDETVDDQPAGSYPGFTTSSGGYQLGSITDTVTANTFYGHIRVAIAGILTAKPSIRLIFVTPYYNNDNYGDFVNSPIALRAVGAVTGIPVISLDWLSGFNAQTIPYLPAQRRPAPPQHDVRVSLARKDHRAAAPAVRRLLTSTRVPPAANCPP